MANGTFPDNTKTASRLTLLAEEIPFFNYCLPGEMSYTRLQSQGSEQRLLHIEKNICFIMAHDDK
ncbi:MAG: hypothetical protein LUH58_07595 [Lachnospiraceae bacterium]|nr:hypothetical protein [Lachnospiraceae bacterium]